MGVLAVAGLGAALLLLPWPQLCMPTLTDFSAGPVLSSNEYRLCLHHPGTHLGTHPLLFP